MEAKWEFGVVFQALKQRLPRPTWKISMINYIATLETELKRSMAEFPKKTKMVYRKDLASYHTSNIVKDKIAKLKLNVLDWAPKSLYLNYSIEIL